MDEAETVRLSQELLVQRIDPGRGIDGGLVDGMRRAGELFEREEYFIPELLHLLGRHVCGPARVAAAPAAGQRSARRAIVVIGVVEGDTHDIGKNLVKIMLETAGFEVVDLGRDVPPATLRGTGRVRGRAHHRPVHSDDHHHGRHVQGDSAAGRKAGAFAHQGDGGWWPGLAGSLPIADRRGRLRGQCLGCRGSGHAPGGARRQRTSRVPGRQEWSVWRRLAAGRPLDRLPCVPIVGNTAREGHRRAHSGDSSIG